jgi:putative transposase
VLAIGDGALGFWAALRDVFPATREHAEAAARSFVAEYGTKWPKAVARITDDLDVLLEFYNHPAEHGSTCVPRTRSSRPSPPSAFGSGSPRGPDRGRLAWRWRSSSSSPPSNGGVPSTHPTSSLVRAGARFEKGLLVERPDESGGDQQVA